MIQPSSSFGPIRETGPLQALRQQALTSSVDEPSEEALEQFLSSWSSGEASGQSGLTLDKMLSIQSSANPDMPPAAEVKPRSADPTDTAVRQIEALVRDNRSVFQSVGPTSMAEGWNIAGPF